MPHDFIPDADGLFNRWQINFVTYALDHHRALGLTSEQIDALGEGQREWIKAYDALVAARAAFESAAAAKADSRRALVGTIREIAGQLRVRPEVDASARAALGLTLPDAYAAPSGDPQTFPLLRIDAGERLEHVIHFVDSATPQRRARPRGIAGLELRGAVRPAGDGPPADPGDYAFIRLATRTPSPVIFSGSSAGQTAWYAARWLSTRGRPGPWGPTSSATIGG
ncbi:MAG: hypothetical protein KF841_08535 [Phycisphaerae bacterium]|nr:hypothetical protein [Phycisphaerae bacterium]